MARYFLLASIFIYSPVFAISLFGVDLSQATRDEMRNAVRQSGATLIREAGSDGFYDEYKSDRLLPGSSRLYLGYVKKDSRLAFVEYSFGGLTHPQLIHKLSKKYGKAQVNRASFQSDTRYEWKQDGVRIQLYQDWSNYKVRLLYAVPENLTALRREYQQFKAAEVNAQAVASDLAY